MKVLLVNSLYAPNETGGAEISVKLLAAGLRSTGVTVVVATTAADNRVDTIDGNRVYYVRTPNCYWVRESKQQALVQKLRWHVRDAYNPRVDSVLRDIIRRENPDIVHTHNLAGWSTYTWTVARSENRKVIHTIRDLYLLCSKSTMYRDDRNCLQPCLICAWQSRRKQRGFQYLDGVTAVSDFVLSRHREQRGLPAARKYVRIPNAIEEPTPGEVARHTDSELRFGFVGLLAPHKGVEALLLSFTEASLPNASLSLYGRGFTQDYEDRLTNRFRSPNIRFCGWRLPREIYSELDVLIVPSLCHEAFGRVIPEAYANAIPVIATRRGGLPEIVKEGLTGFLYEPDSEHGLRMQMERFVSRRDLKVSLAMSCLNEARQFSTLRITQQYRDLYEEVLS